MGLSKLARCESGLLCGPFDMNPQRQLRCEPTAAGSQKKAVVSQTLLARNEGLAVGSESCTVMTTKGVKRARLGNVPALATTKGVKRPADAENGLDDVTISCPLDALKVPGAKQAKKTVVAVEQPVAKGMEWKVYDDEVIMQAVRHHLAGFTDQLRIQFSPNHEDVAILLDHRIMVAKTELQPFALRIIPKTNDLRLAVTGEDADITVEIPGAKGAVQFKTIGPKDNLGRDIGTTLVVEALEFIAASSKEAREHDQGYVELKRVTSDVLTVPFVSEYTTSDVNLRPNTNTANVRLACKISYWTNETKVQMGSALALARNPVR